MTEKKKDNELAVEAFRKGPLTPEQLQQAQGHQYVSKMIYFLKKQGFEFDIKKDGAQVVLITMTKEGKLPERKVAAPKPPVIRTGGNVATRKPSPFNRPRPSNNMPANNMPVHSGRNDMDDFTIDPDFDNTTLDDVFNSFRG